jgi:hypothetical protein
MGTAKQTSDEPDMIALTSHVARLVMDIEQYELLLQSSLGPKARRMFEHLLDRSRAELAPMEAEVNSSRALAR